MVKCSAGCEQGVFNLAAEAIGACLAGDLGLPVPEPFLVDLDPAFISAVTEPAQKQRMAASNPVAFGSKLMPSQYTTWSTGMSLSISMLPVAAAVFAYDGIAQNFDRRDGNPNCKVKGDQIRIFDHDMAFANYLPILFWQPPWTVGGLKHFEKNGAHIFWSGLKGKQIDFDPIRQSWAALSDAQIKGYGLALPPNWGGAAKIIDSALQLIQDARDNIDACISEIQRVLK